MAAVVPMEWEKRLGRRLRVRDLYILSTVVKTGGMAKAARQLAMSQPSVSEAIANLEHLLRVRLLDRSTRGVAPTIYADAILKRSMTVFDELKQGVRDIEFLSDPTSGVVTVGYTDMLEAVFPKIIERFTEKYPRVVVQAELVRSPIAESLSGLADRTFDLILARPPQDEDQVMEAIQSDFLFEDPMVIVVGTHSRWARRRKIDLADLVDAPWILPPPKGLSHRFVAEACNKLGLSIAAASIVTSTLDLRVSLLASGRFISVLPRSVYLRDRVRHGLKMLAVDMPTRSWPVMIFALKNRTVSPVVERFVDCAHEVAKTIAGRPATSRQIEKRLDVS
jgi:DNA-binding transcriptional LysR family regulator